MVFERYKLFYYAGNENTTYVSLAGSAGINTNNGNLDFAATVW